MGEYDGSIALATRLIKKKGSAVKLRTLADNPPADPSKPWQVPGQAPTDYNWHGLFLNYSLREINGESVLQGDQRVLAVPDTVADVAEPTPKARVVRGTEVWTIVAVSPLNPGGQIIYYDLQVRR